MAAERVPRLASRISRMRVSEALRLRVEPRVWLTSSRSESWRTSAVGTAPDYDRSVTCRRHPRQMWGTMHLTQEQTCGTLRIGLYGEPDRRCPGARDRGTVLGLPRGYAVAGRGRLPQVRQSEGGQDRLHR